MSEPISPDRPHDAEHIWSAGDLMVAAERWLVEHPDGPLSARICMAVVVASHGDLRKEANVIHVAHHANCLPETVVPILAALKAAQEEADG